MSLNELMFNAFSSCNVINGEVRFNSNFSTNDIMEIYSQFSKDLLSANIPNIRVVGIYKSWDDTHQKSSFRHNDVYGMSLIELAERMKWVIPEDIGGNNPEKGCFYGVNEVLENRPEFNNMFGQSESMKAGTKTANLLTQPSTVIGSIMQGIEAPMTGEVLDKLNTSKMWYTQYSMVESASYPNMLFPNMDISDIVRDGAAEDAIVMFIMEGTGRLDYKESQDLFKDRMDKIFPCRTNFDLSKFFTCAYPNGRTNSLKLVYRVDGINESVLTTILQRYGRKWC